MHICNCVPLNECSLDIRVGVNRVHLATACVGLGSGRSNSIVLSFGAGVPSVESDGLPGVILIGCSTLPFMVILMRDAQ